jgi:hypothetical protein
MGRSQVLRNQRQGRPGQKGRGDSGGRTSSSKQEKDIRPQQQVVGNNAWRFQEETLSEDDDTQLDEKLLALESHGKYANQVTEEVDSMTITATFKLNVDQIQKGLASVSLSEILGLPPHLTASLEEQSRHLVGATLRQSNKDTQADASEKKVVLVDAETKDKNDSKENDEDDMESWLDSVIS